MLHELQATAQDEGQRLDLFIGKALALSRAKVKALLEEGAVRVDGRRPRKGQPVASGQKVTVELEELPTGAVAQADLPLTVLWSDESLIFVDKPAKVPSHPLKPGETGTVANALVHRFPECAEASEDAREGGLCHRLDVETSGVLLAARSRPVWTEVRRAFTERSVDKHYWALARGPLADEGEIELPLRHHPRHPDRVEPDVQGSDGAREAVSSFRVLERHGELCFVEVKILTGVLHQVRAHLAAIGAPLVGDELYGGPPEPSLDRFFLHARSLGLGHPVTGRRLEVLSPLPPELRRCLEAHGMGRIDLGA